MAAPKTDIDLFSLLGEQTTIIETPRDSAIRPTRGAFWDHSGTITTANASQIVMRERDSRCYLLFQNLSNQTMWLSFSRGAIASQPSVRVDPGDTFVMD